MATCAIPWLLDVAIIVVDAVELCTRWQSALLSEHALEYHHGDNDRRGHQSPENQPLRKFVGQFQRLAGYLSVIVHYCLH